MNMFSVGKKILGDHPGLLNIASLLHNAFFFNRIKGRRDNRIIMRKSFLKRCKIIIKGRNNIIEFGEKCYLAGTRISISGNGNILRLGEQTVIHQGEICIEDDKGSIQIGKRTLICGPCHMAEIEGTEIYIGEGTLFSSETVLRTGDSHSILDNEGKRTNISQSIRIGNRVWVGYRALICKGVEIKEDSVIATGAIVTHSCFEPNSIIGGIPARQIKSNISWKKERVKNDEYPEMG